MKKYILLILIPFLAPTFQSDNPPGWYEQFLPVNDQINDIYFIDTLNGWLVTYGDDTPADTGYIMHTTNGGSNWTIQYSHLGDFNSVRFFDTNTGYVFGNNPNSIFLKTTNGGLNWIDMSGDIPIFYSRDMQFLNKDTGWICSDITIGGGVAKTTNGGINWELQLGQEFKPNKVFFVNPDTGWVLRTLGVLYKTTNGGNNWFTQYNFSHGISDLFMSSSDTGWITGGATGILKTTNGGDNWFSQDNPGGFGDGKFFFLNNTTGWVGSAFSRILATTDGDTWGLQTTPSGNFYNVYFIDSSYGFAGGSKLIKTTDGGGPINSITQLSNEIPQNFKLHQNYPNPFNPTTIINFELRNKSIIELSVYSIAGKFIMNLVNTEQLPGTYQYTFDASGLPSGIYFYTLIADGISVDTKKMVLLK